MPLALPFGNLCLESMPIESRMQSGVLGYRLIGGERTQQGGTQDRKKNGIFLKIILFFVCYFVVSKALLLLARCHLEAKRLAESPRRWPG